MTLKFKNLTVINNKILAIFNKFKLIELNANVTFIKVLHLKY